MDVDSAWNDFKQSNVRALEKSNQTSVEDKLDVILAQQQEILTDTSRVADLVPMVTGDKAQQDALEESGDLEGNNPEVPMEGSPEDPMNGMADAGGVPEQGADAEAGGDNPFAFLDEDDTQAVEGDAVSEAEAEDDGFLDAGEDEDYEITDEDSDVESEGQGDEASEPTDEGTAEASSQDIQSSDDVQSKDESKDASGDGANSDDGSGTEEADAGKDYISFDEISEDDEDDGKAKKSAEIPITKTIKSFGTKTPMTIIGKVDRPIDALSYGKVSSAEEISEMLTKSQSDEEFRIGYGVDPHEVTKNDWAMLRTMMKLNQF